MLCLYSIGFPREMRATDKALGGYEEQRPKESGLHLSSEV